jgi:hypothetical protein
MQDIEKLLFNNYFNGVDCLLQGSKGKCFRYDKKNVGY